MTGRLRLKYVPLSQARLWDDNPKPHDIGTLILSFRKYGFKDPPKFEPELNGGEGGIVEGNGRIEALSTLFSDAEGPPDGIAVTKAGEWSVPILFGVDAKSEAQAEAYAIDHNSLTLTGGDFGPDYQRRLYDLDGLIVVGTRLGEKDMLPLTLDSEDLASLVDFQSHVEDPPDGWADPEDGEGAEFVCPSCGYEWRGKPS